MSHWSPDSPRDPATWLALDPDEAATAIAAWHQEHLPDRLHRDDVDMARHARLHEVIERQLALDDPPDARVHLERLVSTGLRRHPALHLLMGALAGHLVHTLRSGRPADPADYAARLAALDPADAVYEGLRRNPRT